MAQKGQAAATVSLGKTKPQEFAPSRGPDEVLGEAHLFPIHLAQQIGGHVLVDELPALLDQSPGGVIPQHVHAPIPSCSKNDFQE